MAGVTNHEHWLHEPEEHDYPAAADYLTLNLDPGVAETVVAALEKAPLVHRKAKDLLRASGLALLPPDNPHVARARQPEVSRAGGASITTKSASRRLLSTRRRMASDWRRASPSTAEEPVV